MVKMINKKKKKMIVALKSHISFVGNQLNPPPPV